MSTTLRRARAATLALVLIVGAAACSSDASESDADDAGSVVTAAVDAAGAPDSAPAAETDAAETETTAAADGETSVDPADCDADQQAGIDSESMSRSATVLFSADSKSGVSDADITAETTMAIQADGTLVPATLEVAVGQVFGILPAAGASLDAVKIGCADAQTLLPGSAAGFVITQPGTYPISLEIAGTSLGTVTAS